MLTSCLRHMDVPMMTGRTALVRRLHTSTTRLRLSWTGNEGDTTQSLGEAGCLGAEVCSEDLLVQRLWRNIPERSVGPPSLCPPDFHGIKKLKSNLQFANSSYWPNHDLVADCCLRKSISSIRRRKILMNCEPAWCHSTKYDFGILMVVSEISCICEP